MADTSTPTQMSNGATSSESALLLHIPIAQLSPLLAAPSTRSVKAIVTLTWPYSSATGSVAFLLAEPDFRLRRTRGQVRVQFSGSSAKAVAKAGIASGDEVILSLDGVDWVQDETPFATPGRGLEFGLKFTERLLLQFRQEDSQEINVVDIDHPTPEPEAPAENRIPAPEADPFLYATANSFGSLVRPSPLTDNSDEWSSPAFIKRARTSYGSLFDKEYDPFAEEDGTLREKGRKRARLSSMWRYESRSPSPEVEENTMDGAPELEVQQKTVMTDEGCQTVMLEDGDAAEVLADFQKQATNVVASSYIDIPARSQGEADSDLHRNAADLPMIQTQPDQDITKLSERAYQTEPAPQKAPSLARLQPVSADTLPPISPLVANKFGAFLGMGPVQGFGGQVPSMNEQMPTLTEEPMLQVADGEQEDLYGASPAALHGQVSINELNGFQHPSVGITGSVEAASDLGGQLLSEDQYGHSQSATAQLSRGGSPDETAEDIRENDQRDGFYMENPQLETNFQNNGFPVPGVEDQHLQQYPDPEEEYHSQLLNNSWGHRSGEIAYPGFQNTEEEFNENLVTQQALHPRAVAMSRSGSAQSGVIDLTESSDEEEADVEDEMDVPYEGSIDQQDHPQSDISEGGFVVQENQRSYSDESSEDDEEGSVSDEHAHERYFHNGPRVDKETSQNSEDEEVSYEEDSYEDEFAEDNDTYRGTPPFDEEQDFDEESSYDEDMEEDKQPHVQRAPVVIDLLSSDDEDGGNSAPELESEPASPTRGTKAASARSLNEEGKESDENLDSEEDMDAEQDTVPQPQAYASKVITEQEFGKEDDDERLASEAEGNFAVAKQDDGLRDSGDEESVKDDALDDRDYAKGPADFNQDTKLAQEEAVPVDETSGGPSEGADSTIKEANPEAFGRESLHRTPTLQTVEETSPNPKSAEKDTELVPLNVGRPSNQPNEYIPAAPRSFAAQMFSLDGANDELPNLYPVLPKEDVDLFTEASPPTETSQTAVSVQDQVARRNNDQLPTPADTQISLVKESSEISESSVMGQTILSESVQTTADESPIYTALDPAPQPMQLDTNALANNTKANAETEINGGEAIHEETAKITLEESNIGKAEDGETANVVIEAHHTRSRTRQQNGSVEPAVQEVQSIDEVVRSSPRRSHRRGKSMSSATESPQAKLPSTPANSASRIRQDGPVSARSDRSSLMVLDEHTTPKGHDASIELAMSALDSPVKQQHDLRSNQPDMNRKLKLTRALRTELSEFTALKSLRFHLGEKLDVLGVVTTVPPEPERAKKFPRHYQISFNITDQSIVPGSSIPITEVQVFRPYKDALPIANVGDGILLRNFAVISVKNNGFALQSTDASSWAVFKGEEDKDIEMRGPPVEFGPGEQKQTSMLREWYTGLDAILMGKINKANGDKHTAGAGKGFGKAL